MSESFVFTTNDPPRAAAVLAAGLYEGWCVSCYRVPRDAVPYLRPDIRRPSNGYEDEVRELESA